MKKVIVGHRGVGKSEFLKRHAIYLHEAGMTAPHFDLDLMIEKKEKKLITEIFKLSGEWAFRKLEAEMFAELVSTNSEYVICLGAGFDLSLIPSGTEIFFLSRITDSRGRIFLSRPRLNKALSSLEEYSQKYLQRQPQFLDQATSVYFMPEGIDATHAIESKIILQKAQLDKAFYTLTNKETAAVSDIKKNYKKIELRTDLISIGRIKTLVDEDRSFNWLISIRTQVDPILVANIRYDFDCTIKNIPAQFFLDSENIISSHHDQLQAGIEDLKPFHDIHKKLCPLVENFEDLWTGHHWQQEDSKNRSFLPRSETGKWLWYRQLSPYWQKINFVRSFTNMQDQPSLYHYLSTPIKRPQYFGAVVGQPVQSSRSPRIHSEFFAAKKSFFTAIDIDENDFSEFFPWLIKLGLKYLAVTSPLKKKAFELSNRRSDLALKLHSANTLAFEHEQIYSHNTDYEGFKSLIEKSFLTSNDKIAVWGGGGTLDMMQALLPEAKYFSSRTATLKDRQLIDDQKFMPDILIWSAPRLADTKWPNSKWSPKLVIDLNYQENSMGLEYAQRINAEYLSGLTMFQVQAEAQQHYWSQI